MAEPLLYPSCATVEHHAGAKAVILAPFTGELAPGLRRRASTLLREQAVDGERIRAVASTIRPHHLIVTIAGTPPAITDWVTGGRIARAAAIAITQAADNADHNATAPTRLQRLHAKLPATPKPRRGWRPTRRAHNRPN